MLYVTLDNGKEAGILFRHERQNIETVSNKTKEVIIQPKPFRTTCSIFINEVAIGTGIAKVDSRDQFKYSKGRKTALKSALEAADLNKLNRTAVWQQYHAR